jgi:hypothetical protein
MISLNYPMETDLTPTDILYLSQKHILPIMVEMLETPFEQIPEIKSSPLVKKKKKDTSCE